MTTRSKTLTIVTVVGVVGIVGIEFAKGHLVTSMGLSEHAVEKIEFGSIILLMLLVLNLVFHFSSATAEEVVEQVDARLNSQRPEGGQLTMLSSSALYRELVGAVESARHRVCNTYLGSIPPDVSNLPEKQAYFRNLLRDAKKKKTVEFRRIVMLSEANRAWVKQLIKDYSGLTNVSIAVYRGAPENLTSLSVQVIDNNALFIIHAAARPPGQLRDMMIKDKAAVAIFSDYYESLWKLCDVALEKGKVNSDLVNSL